MTSIFLKKRFLTFCNRTLTGQDKIFVSLLFLSAFIYPLPHDIFDYQSQESVRVYDRNGYMLREIISLDQGRGRWSSLENISPKALIAAVYAEDRRFYAHRGIDVLALGRAVLQNIRAGETVSGGSTISAQLVRNLYGHPRNLFYKIIENWQAVRLEHTLKKNEILEHYLNRIPFGNQTFGIEAASQLYFGKSAAELSWAESAFLMALPKSPTQYNPYRNFAKAKERQEIILRQLREYRQIDDLDFDRAVLEPILLFPKTSPFNAPHFVDWIMKQPNHESDLHTSLDLPLQQACEKIVQAHVEQLKAENVSNAAVLVTDNATGQIRVMIGSADYFNETRDGQFNAVFAKRQPGSALKPFTYALAFDRGYTPATIIPDVETVIESKHGRFTPLNYDNQFHGPVRARVALACSYNVPAVRILQDIGVDRLLSKLHECGFRSLTESADHYGHGLTLGNGEVTLYELARAYAILANRGRPFELTYDITSSPFNPSRKLFSESSVFFVSDILSDASARAPAFGYDSPLSLPFPCAAKTGTSSDYRDNWTAGYTRDYTVVVWVGNFDNQPMVRISGVTGAGPIFREIMLLLHRKKAPSLFPKPSPVAEIYICGTSGDLPHNGCPYIMKEYFENGKEPKTNCSVHDNKGFVSYAAFGPVFKKWSEMHSQREKSIRTYPDDSLHPASKKAGLRLKIISPARDAEFKIDPNHLRQYQSIDFDLFAPEGVTEVTWYLNGQFYSKNRWPYKTIWNLRPGTFILKAETRYKGKTLSDEGRFSVLE